MRIVDDFVRDNQRIEVLSGGGSPTRFPEKWGRVLGDSDLVVAIPDMHMFLYQSNLDNFKFGADAMLDFLAYLQRMQWEMFCEGRKLRVVQLGDMYELRFPNAMASQSITSREIRRSHPHYAAIVNALRDVNATLIYGNHDYEHRTLREYCESVRDGHVYLEHGYSADRWYHFSNPNRAFWQPMMTVFRTVRAIEASLAGIRRNWMKLPEDRHVAIGVISGELEISHYPDGRTYPRHAIEYFSERIRRSHANDDTPRVCVAAHTHHPYLDPEFADGRAVYIDAGAWTDGRTDFAVITNDEAAICRYRRTAAPAGSVPYRRAI